MIIIIYKVTIYKSFTKNRESLKLIYRPKMDFRSIILILFIIVTVTSYKKSYGGYKVYNVIPDSKDKLNILNDIEKNGIGEFWMEPFNVNQAVKLMVSKEKQSIFVEQMNKAGIKAVEVIKDLQK